MNMYVRVEKEEWSFEKQEFSFEMNIYTWK